MNVTIRRSNIHGVITAPPSKSITHRAIIIAALAQGVSTIRKPLLSDDIHHTIDACKALGVIIESQSDALIIHGTGGKLIAPAQPIHCGNSGTTLRMMTAVATLAKGTTILTGEKRLCERPIGDLIHSLRSLGVTIRAEHEDTRAPITIQGAPIEKEKASIKGSVSSQYISALLLIAPFAKKGLRINVEGIVQSKPYIAVTLAVMQEFGILVQNKGFREFIIKSGQTYASRDYTVEGDYSSSSYFFAAAAITGGPITVNNLRSDSAQGDRKILSILEAMGCTIRAKNDSVTVVRKNGLRSLTVDMGGTPDIVQTVAVIAAYAKGETNITNIAHLRFKETDRITHPAKELSKMGIRTRISEDSLHITGGSVHGSIIETYNDHRMAMSFTIAGLGASGETTIMNAEVVSKSFPSFFAVLAQVGGEVEAV